MSGAWLALPRRVAEEPWRPLSQEEAPWDICVAPHLLALRLSSPEEQNSNQLSHRSLPGDLLSLQISNPTGQQGADPACRQFTSTPAVL